MSSGEKRFLCRVCRHVFDIRVLENGLTVQAIICPACGAKDITEAPAWAPLGSGWNIFEGNEWEYECQECRHTFKMPIPRSPAEEKARRCPACESGHLHRFTGGKALPLHCG